MNRFVRTAPTRRLLAALLGICVLIAAGSTLAVAASSGGPVPPAKPLPQAIHNGLAAPPVNGISADITFKNNLIDASELQGSDPLLSGGSGRLWLSGDHQFRLELQTTDGGRADAQIVVNRRRFWAYDPSSNTAYTGSLPADTGHKRAGGRRAARDAVPTVARIQTELKRVMQHAKLAPAIPGDVAGQPAYTVRITPKDTGGLIGGAELAWDAAHGVPLRVALYARGDATPVLELDATNVSYGPQPASVFSIAPPADAKLVNVDTQRLTASETKKHRGKHGRHREISGVAAVAGHLPFSLDAPATLAGLPRTSVSLVGGSKHPAALIVYGQGLGSVVVIEQAARRSRGSGQSPNTSQGGDRQGLTLPTVQVGGTTATELDTAIGSLVRFTRAGVTYVVAGSVTRSVADAAARGL